MMGRPRLPKASPASTISTSDRSQIRWSPEKSLLKPASIEDPNCPCYVLKDATIYREDRQTLANPLVDYVHGTMVVQGFLEEPEKDTIANLVRPNVKTGYIEISKSRYYAIGDGPLSWWVSGDTGWFEIKPSAKYQRMYNQVMEAITLYYSAYEVEEAYIQACEKERKRKKGQLPPPPPLDKVFLKYAVRVGDGILRHEVEALCHKWAGFLIAHFQRENALDWDTSAFANWLREHRNDLHTKAANGVVGPLRPSETPNRPDDRTLHKGRSKSARASSRNSEVEDNSRGSTLKRSLSPQPELLNRSTPKTSETPVPLPEKYRLASQPSSTKPPPAPVQAPKDTPSDTPTWEAEPNNPVDRLLSVLLEIGTETDIREALPKTIHSKLYFKCRINKYQHAADMVAYYAKELLPRVPAEWKGTPWQQWLASSAKRPWNPAEPLDPGKIPAMTFRRTKAGSKTGVSTKPATQLPPTINLKPRAKKAGQNGSDEESDDDAAGQYAAPQRGRWSGKGATLRLAASSKKRPLSEVDDPVNGSRRGRKSAKSIHRASDEDEQAEEPDDSSDDEVVDNEDMAVGSRLPLPEGAVRVVVHAERIPTTSPSGPDGTWTCEEEGCMYVVRSANEEDAQQQIKEHFKVHEAQAEKINLAVKESRGHMPIKYAYFPPVLLLVYMHPNHRGTYHLASTPAPFQFTRSAPSQISNS
ncbi:hypothetical protein N657DRAFT_611854 [Parathielavia appendiculata]|uniref:Uncharacterized protein n=1 Tax=Parathielavia appendiculata TaxID=2587402 RepID=A0AAN6U6L2_9PEZI|nr:hypothetical protein N657DRAFT_611854 [Parathielavia appendiculata]